MPVPANLAALSTTASSNSPAGTEQVFPQLDDYLRTGFSFIAQLRDEKLALSGGTLTGALNSSTTIQSGSTSQGYVRLNPGNSSAAGYVGFHLPSSGTRVGYIGFVDANYVYLTAENSRAFRFTGLAPKSAVAAAATDDLVRKGEMDAAISTALGQATETFQGTAEVATQVETDAVTDDARIVTPKKLGNGLAMSIAANGYIKFPSWLGGLVIQWGSQAFSAGSGGAGITVTFPAAFPTACYVFVGNSTANSAVIVEPTVLSTTGASVSVFQRDNGAYGAGNVLWIAIGK